MVCASKKWLQDHVSHEGNECLTYPFYRPRNGYGVIWDDGRRTGAHRLMCRLAHGEPEDEKLEAAHSCGNGHLGCVNPNHLRWKTRSANILESAEHGRVFNKFGRPGTRRDGTYVPAGVGGVTKGRALVTAEQVSEIRRLKAEGKRVKDLAGQYGVHYSTISKIVSGANWADVA